MAEKRRDNGVSGRRGSGRIPKALCGRNEKQVRFLIARHVKYAAFVVHGGTIMAVMHALYEEKKIFITGRWRMEAVILYLYRRRNGRMELNC